MDLDRLPVRGTAVRDLDLALPAPGVGPVERGVPRNLPLISAGRPLKRWRYVAAFGPELMVCAGDARIGPLRQRWWAVAEPGAPLVERTSMGGAGMELDTVRMELPETSLDDTPAQVRLAIRSGDLDLQVVVRHEDVDVEPVEVVSPSGSGWAWTRKQAGLPAWVTIERDGRRRSLHLEAVIDDSVGYHGRRTAWRWSTGVGRAETGARIGWNLVSGVHDAAEASERTMWVDGEPTEVGPARFEDDLSAVETADGGRLAFTPWASREHSMNLLLVRSEYRQPFGTFAGELPGGLRLAEGYGVMEEHDARW